MLHSALLCLIWVGTARLALASTEPPYTSSGPTAMDPSHTLITSCYPNANESTTYLGLKARTNVKRVLKQGDQLEITCELRDELKECANRTEWLQGMTVAIEQDNSPIRELKSATKNIITNSTGIKINTTIEEPHSTAQIVCQFKLEGNVIVESKKEYVNQVHEQHHLVVSAGKTTAYTGDTIALSCRTVKHKNKSLERIEWKMSESKQLENSEDVKKLKFEKSNTNPVTDVNDEGVPYKVIEVSYEEPWTGYYKCSRTIPYNTFNEESIYISFKRKDHRSTYAVVSIVTIFLVVSVTATALYVIRKRQLKNKIAISMRLMEVKEANKANEQSCAVQLLDPTMNPYQSDTLDGTLGSGQLEAKLAQITHTHGHWQKNRDTITVERVIGEGNFGSVCLGTMVDPTRTSDKVAIKTIKPGRLDRQAIIEFEKEIDIMTTLHHEYIVSLVGLCTETMPLFIIMEFMEGGPLNQYLIDNAPSRDAPSILTPQDLLMMGLQPCKAMEYLASKNIVHRDVSARNCLVGENKTVKLADFGLSRGTAREDGKNYYKKDGGMVPVKWMSPEALTFGKYSSASDVWSCGVLLWEIYSYGAMPYATYSNQDAIVFIGKEGRLAQPITCPTDVWRAIQDCWVESPADRITINGLVNKLSIALDSH